MAKISLFVILPFLAVCGSSSTTVTTPSLVTPVAKVIALMQDMKSKAEGEGTTEATSYGEFSCFCKTTTQTKSKALVSNTGKVKQLAADIEEATSLKNKDSAELATRQAAQEKNTADLAQSKHECAEQKAEFEAAHADVTKAIFGVTKAIESMEGSKPSLLQVAIPADVVEIVAMADAMGLVHPQHKAASEFLQSKGNSAFLQQKLAVDPIDPAYKYHSDEIISLCKDLKKQFEDQKDQLVEDDQKATKSCTDTQSALTTEIGLNKKAMSDLSASISGFQSKISEDLGTLQTTQATMLDDKAYLKDLTKQCEDSAADWDQRSVMRKNEIATLTDVLDVLEKKVKPTDVAANVRALVQVKAKASTPALKAISRAVSFVEVRSESKSSLLSSEKRKELALATLQKEGQRLHSVALQSLSAHVAGDPFMKVKELIQKLIERLVSEAAAEAEKKGYCDTQLGKLKQDRSYRYNDVVNLNAEIAELEAKRDTLTSEISTLKTEINQTRTDLSEATTLREQGKEDNLLTLKNAKDGLEALEYCIETMETFYRTSARATVLAQVSPVDEDTSGAGFKGAYQGQQVRSEAVLGLLQTIKSDYERTIKRTTAEEAEAHADFTELKRSSEADISGKSKKLELSEEDKTTTLVTIDSKMGDMQTNMDLLDKAVKELQAINKLCVDSGMSYADRKSTREDEIAALKKALCQLDTDGVEQDCTV